MNPLLRLIILPAITGIIIAAGILFFFPSHFNSSGGGFLSQQTGPASYAEAVKKAATLARVTPT